MRLCSRMFQVVYRTHRDAKQVSVLKQRGVPSGLPRRLRVYDDGPWLRPFNARLHDGGGRYVLAHDPRISGSYKLGSSIPTREVDIFAF
jgi:hypothetical protein